MAATWENDEVYDVHIVTPIIKIVTFVSAFCGYHYFAILLRLFFFSYLSLVYRYCIVKMV